MKNLIISMLFILIYINGFSQILTDIDEISPFVNDNSAIKKGNKWAFINKEGEKIIDFREDIVLTNREVIKTKATTDVYPLLVNNRCLIKKLKGDFYYFGYINNQGEEVIKPQFLNATEFSNGYAIVVMHSKDSIGYNEVLKKPIISNKIEEYVIDSAGELVKYLYNPRNYVPTNYRNNIPPIQSKFIAPNLVAVKNKNNKWDIHKF